MVAGLSISPTIGMKALHLSTIKMAVKAHPDSLHALRAAQYDLRISSDNLSQYYIANMLEIVSFR